MAQLSLKCYILDDGTDPIRCWYEGQSQAVRGLFEGTLDIMRSISLHRIDEGVLKQLQDRPESKCGGLYEILVEKKDADPPICHRILGVVGPRPDDFTMLHPFDKQVDASYESPCGIAQERKKQVSANARIARECRF